jgi:hypothetical protein
MPRHPAAAMLSEHVLISAQGYGLAEHAKGSHKPDRGILQQQHFLGSLRAQHGVAQ